MDQCITK